MRKNTWGIATVLIIAALLLGGLALLNTQQNVERQPLQGIGGGPDDRTIIADIIANPDSYIAKAVTVNGEVDRVLSPEVFVLDQEKAIVGDEILVLMRNNLPEEINNARNSPLNDADLVSVSGTVQQVQLTEIEREFNLNLDSQLEDQPVIVATNITRQNTD